MELFLQKFLSIYFVVLIVISVAWLVIKIFRNLLINSTIENLIRLPDDRKARVIRLYRSILSGYRIFVWIMPFGLLLMLAALVLLAVFPEISSEFDIDMRQLLMIMGISFLVVFIHVLEDSSYKKKILKAIDKS